MKYLVAIAIALIIFLEIIGIFGVTKVIINANKPIPTPTPITYPNGYDVLDAVNSYRNAKGLPNFILSSELCRNLAARAISYEKTNSHDGFAEWVRDNNIYGHVAENLAWGTSAAEIVSKWAGSPGHNLALLKYTYACTYSENGYTVIMMKE